MVDQLDQGLKHYATVVKRELGTDLERAAGAGAAGGLGFGLLAFTGARMQRGVDLVLRFTHFKQRVAGADYVLTGEGQIDYQTGFGKAPVGVARAASDAAPTAPVIALAGSVGRGADSLYDDFAAIFATPQGAKDLQEAVRDARSDVSQTAENVARLLRLSR